MDAGNAWHGIKQSRGDEKLASDDVASTCETHDEAIFAAPRGSHLERREAHGRVAEDFSPRDLPETLRLNAIA
jgi:hypothetical protein